MLAAVSLSAVRNADARPKRRDAKAAFDRGVVAYQKGNYQGASEALGKSFELERDVDTLFAWAQSERRLNHCEKAMELYEQLLTFNLPTANKSAVEGKLAECRTIIAEQHAPPAAAPPVEPAPAPPSPAPPAPSAPAVTPPSTPVAAAATPVRPPQPEESPAASSAPRTPYVFYKDPVTLGLGGAGIVALGVGVGFLAAAHSASSDAKAATTYQQVQDANSRVGHRNNIGGGGMITGGLLVAGGVGWVLWKRHDSGERRTVTGWLAPGGGGLVIAGPF